MLVGQSVIICDITSKFHLHQTISSSPKSPNYPMIHFKHLTLTFEYQFRKIVNRSRNVKISKSKENDYEISKKSRISYSSLLLVHINVIICTLMILL